MPGSAWDGEGGQAARRGVRIGTAFALITFLMLGTSGRPWMLFEKGPFTSDFYDAQARALSRGRLSVPPEVAGIEGFVVDGETHFYYGIVPALARVPISAVTTAGAGRLVLVSQLIALGVACMAGARLLRRAQRALRLEPPASWAPWLTGGFAAAVGMATPLLWLSSRALVYHEAEMWGAALALLGLERVIVWWETRRPLDLLWAAGAATLALSTRGSSGIGPALALGGLGVVLGFQRRWRLAAWVACAAVVPFVFYAVVNMARFGTPFSVPFEQQVLNSFSPSRRAALADNGGTLFGFEFVPTAMLQYLRPDTVEPRALLPWFSWGDPARVVGDVTYDEIDRSASLPVTAPAFLVAGLLGVVALVRRRPPAAWAMAVAGAALATVPTLAIAFIAHRYLADFVPAVVVAAALGVPGAVAWAARSGRRAVLTATGTIVLLGATFVVNAGLGVLARRLYLLPDAAERTGFVSVQYDVHDALGGSRPPDVSVVAALGPPGRDGAVVVVGRCDALYRSDGTRWRQLELRPGGAQRVVVEGGRPGTIVEGDGWRIDLVEDDEGRRFTYVGPDATTVRGDRAFTDPRLRVDVAADPTVPTVIVRVDGQLAVEAFLQPATGPLRVAGGWTPVPGDAPLCDRLVRRLQS